MHVLIGFGLALYKYIIIGIPNPGNPFSVRNMHFDAKAEMTGNDIGNCISKPGEESNNIYRTDTMVRVLQDKLKWCL